MKERSTRTTQKRKPPYRYYYSYYPSSLPRTAALMLTSTFLLLSSSTSSSCRPHLHLLRTVVALSTNTSITPRQRQLQRIVPASASSTRSHLSFLHDRSQSSRKNSRGGSLYYSNKSTGNTDIDNSITNSNNMIKETKSKEVDAKNGFEIPLLPFEDHTHNSVKITITKDVLSNTNSNVDFKTRLDATIQTCRLLYKSSLWITVPMRYASTIEQMTHIPNLQFHHAQGQNAHLSLWLDDNTENKIPDYATHQVGVGALVINSRDEILCVRELRHNYRRWKIPGGLAEVGESLGEAAIREVKEETGIDCNLEDVRVLSFRHSHGMQFGRSDLYFVVRLNPIEIEEPGEGQEEKQTLDGDGDGRKKRTIIPQPVAQMNEIAEALWVPLDDYRAMVNDEERPHFMMQTILQLFDERNEFDQSVVKSVVPGRKSSPIYHAPFRNKK